MITKKERTLQSDESKYPTYKMQSEKQRQSSMIAMQKFEVSAPNYYSELASKLRLRKKRRN